MKKLLPLLLGLLAGALLIPHIAAAVIRILEPDYIRPSGKSDNRKRITYANI